MWERERDEHVYLRAQLMRWAMFCVMENIALPHKHVSDISLPRIHIQLATSPF